MCFNKSLYPLFPTLPYKLNSDTGELNYKLMFEDLHGVNYLLVNTNTLATLDDPNVGYTNKLGISDNTRHQWRVVMEPCFLHCFYYIDVANCSNKHIKADGI